MASVGFRWLDLLEKEFDKAFVDLDLEIGELHYDEPELVYNVRQKLCTLNSCFAQLTHKAQTIFQNSAKIEAELIHMRAELVESKSKRELLEKELHNLLLLVHSAQLSQTAAHNNINKKQEKSVNVNLIKPDVVNSIKKKIEDELSTSPTHITKCKGKENDELTYNKNLLEMAKLRTENNQLQNENGTLRNKILALNSEVYGAKLAAKYLDKELAGRIQQLQLLGREMRSDVRDKLWRQLESEILLQRHKTVVRECRRNTGNSNNNNNNLETKRCPKPSQIAQSFGDLRTVVVKRKQGQGLGISITGGREHGVPILISELEPNGPAAVSGQLYIGDAILSVNDRDLRQACHREAVDILKQQTEDCVLQVQYIAADDDSDNSLVEEDAYNFRYKFFDREVCDPSDFHKSNASDLIINTPTAPRTPESSREGSSSGLMSSRRSLDELMTVAPPPPPPPLPHSPTPAMQETVACILDEPNPIIANLTTQNIAENVINNNNDDDVVVKSTDNLIELNNFNSNNSLNSDNFSSPMQTSCDIFMDSELISIDLTSSNDSESSKNNGNEQRKCETLRKNHGSSNGISKKKKMTAIYGSTETCSPAKSDRSLLNSDDGRPSDDDDDDDEDEGLFATTFNKRAINLNKKKRRNVQPKSCKYFGVKTLQNIFGKYEGYSDISSSSAGDFGGEPDADRAKPFETDGELIKLDDGGKASPDGCDDDEAIVAEPSDDGLSLSRQHFEDNVHAILSEMFAKKNFRPSLDLLSGHARSTTARNCQSRGSSGGGGVTATAMATTAAKKQLRIGKALRLCPNETALSESERKEKLLARYVYNANSIGTVDGVGDPDFGTPV